MTIVWVLNALLMGLLGFLVAEKLSGGLEMIVAWAADENERSFGIRIRSVRPI